MRARLSSVLIATGLAALLAVGCASSDERERALQQGMGFARRALDLARPGKRGDEMLRVLVAQHKGLEEYFAALAPAEGSGIKSVDQFQFGTGPTRPWVVVVRHGAGASYRLEGYGDDLHTPLMVADVLGPEL